MRLIFRGEYGTKNLNYDVFKDWTGDKVETFDDLHLRGSSPSNVIYYTTDGSDPREVGGAVSGTASIYTPGVTVISPTQSLNLKSRSLDTGTWSAISNAVFTVNVPLRVTEIMYNPDISDSKEFIELVNTSGNAIVLNGIHFDGTVEGINFTFAGETFDLLPGERIVVVRNQAAFAVEYAAAITLHDLLILKKNFGNDIFSSPPPAAAAAALTVTISDNTNQAADQVITVLTNEVTDDQTERQDDTLPIRKTRSKRYLESVDQVHKNKLATVPNRARVRPLHRARRGHRTQTKVQTLTDQL